MTTAIDIANWFLASIDREVGDPITPLKLQKLVYYAQAWALALLERPLFEEDLEAWTHGPVVPSLFEQFKDNGLEALPYPDEVPLFDSEVEILLEEILDVYGHLPVRQLEKLIQNEAPWKIARGARPEEPEEGDRPEEPEEILATTPISKETMKTYYQELLEKAESKKFQEPPWPI
jgi:uncharacterized phage-associated protein